MDDVLGAEVHDDAPVYREIQLVDRRDIVVPVRVLRVEADGIGLLVHVGTVVRPKTPSGPG